MKILQFYSQYITFFYQLHVLKNYSTHHKIIYTLAHFIILLLLTLFQIRLVLGAISLKLNNLFYLKIDLFIDHFFLPLGFDYRALLTLVLSSFIINSSIYFHFQKQEVYTWKLLYTLVVYNGQHMLQKESLVFNKNVFNIFEYLNELSAYIYNIFCECKRWAVANAQIFTLEVANQENKPELLPSSSYIYNLSPKLCYMLLLYAFKLNYIAATLNITLGNFNFK